MNPDDIYTCSVTDGRLTVHKHEPAPAPAPPKPVRWWMRPPPLLYAYLSGIASGFLVGLLWRYL